MSTTPSAVWRPAFGLVVSVPDVLEHVMGPIMEAAKAGSLTARDAALLTSADIVKETGELSEQPLDRVLPLLRHVFTRQVSWAIFTTEWMDSLATLISALTPLDAKARPRRRVLEVCAGRGLLERPMQARGFDWISTDARPVSGAAVAQSTALDAVQAHIEDTDLIFWAWWSKHEETARKDTAAAAAGDLDDKPDDRRLAELCVARGIPAVFVGEPKGGITGSSSLWEGPYDIQLAGSVLERTVHPHREDEPQYQSEDEAQAKGHGGQRRGEGRGVGAFVDVPQWPGFSDRTWVIVPGVV
jgi:hypothetical protein